MQTSSMASSIKLSPKYVPKNEIDIFKFSLLFIRQKWKNIVLLGLIWLPVFLIIFLLLWLISTLSLGGVLGGSLLAPLFSSNPTDITIKSLISNFAIPILIGTFLFFILSFAIVYFTYIVYQVSILYLIKSFIYQNHDISTIKAFSLSFSKIPKLLIIYFWRIIYTIIIPNLPHITGILLLIGGASAALYAPFLTLAISFALVYGIYIWVKTTFILIYPVDKDKRDGNSFFEALDFTKGRWLYIFSLLVILGLITFYTTSLVLNLANSLIEKFNISFLQIAIPIITGTILYFLGIFGYSAKYFIFKRIEYQKLAKKDI